MKKYWTSSASSSTHSPPPPSPCSPPPRPPRPKRSLPNLRPRVILSPLAIPPPCAHRVSPLGRISALEGFSADVFASLPEYLKTMPTPASGRTGRRRSPTHPSTRRPMQSPRPGGRDQEPFEFSATMHFPIVRPGQRCQDQHVYSCDDARKEEIKAPRALDSFERAIVQSRTIVVPPTPNLATAQSPSTTASQASSSPHPYSDSYSPTKPKSEAFERAHDSPDVVKSNGTDSKPTFMHRWRLFRRQHRRTLYMLVTVLLVVVAAAAIAGGVIWKLTTCKS